jgi:hypothetical protein
MYDSDIPMLTQAILGIAFNGKNPELVANVNKDIVSIINEGTQGLSDYLEGNVEVKNKFIKQLIKNTIKSLKTSTINSTALEILEKAIKKAVNLTAEDFAVPLSDRDVFSKVSSDMIVSLNKHALRYRLDGIAVI